MCVDPVGSPLSRSVDWDDVGERLTRGYTTVTKGQRNYLGNVKVFSSSATWPGYVGVEIEIDSSTAPAGH
jgi:hypothetical protein